MTDDNRGVAMQQQHGHRLAHDLAAPDDHGSRSGDGNAAAPEHLDHSGRRAGSKQRAALHEAADIDRMKAVDVLGRVEGIEHPLRRATSHRARQRRLDQDSVVHVAGIEVRNELQDFVDGSRRGKALEINPQAGFRAGFDLVADVNVRRGIVSDENHAEAWRSSGAGPKRFDLRPQFLPNRGRNRVAIEQTSRHRISSVNAVWQSSGRQRPRAHAGSPSGRGRPGGRRLASPHPEPD